MSVAVGHGATAAWYNHVKYTATTCCSAGSFGVWYSRDIVHAPAEVGQSRSRVIWFIPDAVDRPTTDVR